jgi:hypothetical protein
MTMSVSGNRGNNLPKAALWLTVGVTLLVVAWLVPVNLKSLTPALLREAGHGSPSVAQYGKQLVESEKLGPAQLVLSAARLVDDKDAGALDRAIKELAGQRPEWVVWGGGDPFLEPLINQPENAGRTESTPVLTFFITEKARRSLENFLTGSRSLGVQAILRTRAIEGTSRFVPAGKPGGQALDAVILLTALLYQSENLSASLQRELRGLADEAAKQQRLAALEPFFIDLLSLGKRLNWAQLCELLRKTDSTKTAGEYAHLARVAKDNLPIIYTAALFSNSADKVASYLIQYGKAGLEDLRLALVQGQGAAQLLLQQQLPLNRDAAPSLAGVAAFALLNPKLALLLKYLGFLVGAFAVFRGLEFSLRTGAVPDSPLRLKSGALALLIAAFLVLATEPFLLKAIPASEFKFKLLLPVLATITDANPQPPSASSPIMENSTLLSIGFFAALQIIMYVLCLMKIREVSRAPVSPLVKLRLMENEENLFDGGLYIGIAGTAASLVLQVLGLIQSNLLAAYSSNLFGIVCVAIVKIRHVRPYKRLLILESQTATAGTIIAPSVAPASVVKSAPVANAS